MRISFSVARHKAHKRLFREAKGQRGGRKNQIRLVKETIVRNRCFAFRDRRVRKRDFRSLWITRINAACQIRGIAYSRFIHGLDLAGVKLNRKMLSELAIHQPLVFEEILSAAKEALAKSAA